jgi:prepilin-type N-terminal cleavage/methylation domain-containing protein
MKHITQKNKNKAFTLIEIMVTIAIIGILAGVVLVSMSSYRDRARATAALQTLSSAMPFATKCALEGKKLNFEGNGNATPKGGTLICDGSSGAWPELGTESTAGCTYQGPGDLTYYQACCGTNSQIICSVTYDNKSQDPTVRPGTCIQWNTNCP